VPPRIRPVTRDDAAELARLRWRFRDELAMVTEPLDEFVPRFEAFVAEALESGRWAMFAAETEGRLVGSAFVQLIPKVPAPTDEGRTIAYVTNVYVEPPLRNAGVGRALVDAALAWARERRPDGAIVWPSGASRSLYERAGFRDDLDVRELRFPEEG
jgi:GNAT superfamily N-acetyltransferase